MYFLNTWEVDELEARYANYPVLDRATRFLAQFRDEVDAHSDGWAYWSAPLRAAEKLMRLINNPPANVSNTDLRKALVPIKAFYTRKGTAAGMRYPNV